MVLDTYFLCCHIFLVPKKAESNERTSSDFHPGTVEAETELTTAPAEKDVGKR